MNRADALALLNQHKPELSRRFGVVELALFGSSVRDETRENSMTGTVVAIYGRGEACAVEFNGLQGGMDVITVYAHDLEEALA